MKVLGDDDAPYLTVLLEAEDFPSREILELLNFDVLVLPDEYDGNSSVLSLAHLFIDQMNMLVFPSRVNQLSPFSKEFQIDREEAYFRGWRVIAVTRRFNYEPFYERCTPMIISLFPDEEPADMRIYGDYLYVVIAFLRLKYIFSSEFGRYVFGEVVGYYKEKYGFFPDSYFLEKIIKEIQPVPYQFEDVEETNVKAIFQLYEEPEVVVDLTVSYTSAELTKLVIEAGISISHVKALNELGYRKVEEVITNKVGIPEEWLDEICPPPEYTAF